MSFIAESPEKSVTITRCKSAGQYDIPVDVMFKLSTKGVDNWGIQGYQVPIKHVDPVRQVKEREYLTQQQGLKDKKYVCRRGSYIEDELKIKKGIPASCNYYRPMSYVRQEDIDKGKKLPHDTKKMTFIESIFQEAQKGSVPGVGQYNVTQTQQQKEQIKRAQSAKKLKYGPRLNFLCEYQYLSVTNPGPGNHNPHEIQDQLHFNRTLPSDFIKKHQDEEQKFGQSKYPDIGTYQPFPAAFETFGRMLENSQQKQMTQVQGFGTEQRFKDPKKSQSKINSINPAPNNYNLTALWPGQKQGAAKDSKKKNWMNSLSQGTTFSIYYK